MQIAPENPIALVATQLDSLQLKILTLALQKVPDPDCGYHVELEVLHDKYFPKTDLSERLMLKALENLFYQKLIRQRLGKTTYTHILTRYELVPFTRLVIGIEPEVAQLLLSYFKQSTKSEIEE